MLVMKIRQDWSQLDATERILLRDELLGLLLDATLAAPLVSQLVRALAALAVNMFEQWSSCVGDLLLLSQSPPQGCTAAPLLRSAVLRVIAALPFELERSPLPYDATYASFLFVKELNVTGSG